MDDGRARLRQALSTLGLMAVAWSAVLLVTGGLAFSVGPIHVSSRNARNPLLGALLLLAGAAVCAPAGSRRRTVAADLSDRLRRAATAFTVIRRATARLIQILSHPAVPNALAATLVALTLAVSWTRGAYIAGGSDSYGYVSEAHLFATGRARVALPLAHAFPHVPPRALAPLGYLPAEDGSDSLVPVYSPGLPLVMAAAERLGGADAVYLVMPLLGALAVWCTYRIGVQLAGPAVGLGAAVLLFASPAFLFQLVGAPLSDIPAAGWWALALTLLLQRSRVATALAGLAAGTAVLTRPNLVLVAAVLGLYVLWDALRTTATRTQAITRVAPFASGVIVACLGVATFNAVWYGSPLRSGYPAGLFSLSYWDDNIIQFAEWLNATQTPIFFLGFAAPALIGWLPAPERPERRAGAVLLVAVVLAVFASYVFYVPFDVWWYLRFLLPAYPPLAVLTCITLAAIGARVGSVMRLICVGVVIGVAAFGLYFSKDMDSIGEYRYRIMGEWVRDHLPARSIVVAMQHGGSVNHYSGRSILRYDLVARGDYESAVNEIIAAGYHPYVVVDDWEAADIRRIHGTGPRGALDWPPVALLPLGSVIVWDLAENRDSARASGRRPELIPIPDAVRRRLP